MGGRSNSYELLYSMSYANSVPDNSDDQSGLCLYIWARDLLTFPFYYINFMCVYDYDYELFPTLILYLQLSKFLGYFYTVQVRSG